VKQYELEGAPHLNQDCAELIVGRLHVLEIRLADGLANNGGDFAIADVALSEQFAGLFALDGWV
jgi:hypothetical protein